MRRMLSALLLFLGLLAGTLALVTYAADTAALAPGGAGRALSQTLDSPAGRAAVRGEVASRVRDRVPGTTPAQARRVAEQVLADPRLPAAADALVGSDPATRSRAVEAALSSLARSDPALARRVRPQVDALLPALRLPVVDRLGAAHVAAVRLGRLATMGAVVLVGSALLVGPRRARLVGRTGWWAALMGLLGAAALWGVPALLADSASPYGQLAVGALSAARPDLAAPLVATLAAGLLAVVVGTAAREVGRTRQVREEDGPGERWGRRHATPRDEVAS